MTSSPPLPAPCGGSPNSPRPSTAGPLLGAVLARGRRTVTSRIRSAKLGARFPSCYTAVAAAGKWSDRIARQLLAEVVTPLIGGAESLTLAPDDTPTKRYGPHVHGTGVHHNPAPGRPALPTSTGMSSSSSQYSLIFFISRQI
ncbi:transposase [Singulisphaera sp. PoT]|uniref:transposase n=1 Tax=Singulisphaera sp. PoT TaxID=3411797 RepID=UPI003BF4A881